MNKRLFKKIVLGGIVSSVAAVATTAFVINSSTQNSSNQNNNTSSYESIYKKQGKANKVGHLPKIASLQNNPAPQMTPYSTAVPKPKIHFLGFKEPSSPSAADGETYYYIENYNANAMEWNQNPYYETITVGDIKNTGNYVTTYNLRAGTYFMDGFGPKSGYR